MPSKRPAPDGDDDGLLTWRPVRLPVLPHLAHCLLCRMVLFVGESVLRRPGRGRPAYKHRHCEGRPAAAQPQASPPAELAAELAQADPAATLAEAWRAALASRRLLTPDLQWHRELSDRRQEAREARDTAFLEEYVAEHGAATLADSSSPVDEGFRRWCTYGAWAICPHCDVLHPRKLTQRSLDLIEASTPYEPCGQCAKPRCYVTPKFSDFPPELVGLTLPQVRALRPIDLHQGDMPKRANGYRVHDRRTMLTWSREPVVDKISALEPACALRTKAAYKWLMANEGSQYASYIRRHTDALAHPGEHGLALPARALLWPCIENALWPHLYPWADWCDSAQHGELEKMRNLDLEAGSSSSEELGEDDGPSQRHRSAKASYARKCGSAILDYAADMSLSHFQFDAHLYRTLAGTKAAAIKHGARHQNTSSEKSWTPEYMRWHHCFIMDVFDQEGEPDLFGTITVNEWEFPYHVAMEQVMDALSRQRTDAPAWECQHHAHVLTQTVLGLLAGKTGDKPTKWREHLLSTGRPERGHEVEALFLHLEYQEGARARHHYHGRGTIHVHYVAWLRDIRAINLDTKLVSSLPSYDAHLAVLADRLQCVRDGAATWTPIREEPTSHEQQSRFRPPRSSRWVMLLQYPVAAARRGLRIAFKTVLRVLRSHSDVQTHGMTSTGTPLLLAYVCKYATKFAENFQQSALRDETSTTGPDATARRVLDQFHPLEPQMWQILCRVPVCRCTWKTKRLRPPLPLQENQHKAWEAYLSRDAKDEALTFLQYARTRHTQGSKMGMAYKSKVRMAVGVRYSKVTRDEFFGQWLCMHVPHRRPADLSTVSAKFVPESLVYFACCLELRPAIWRNVEAIRSQLASQGHRRVYLEDLLAKIVADTALVDHCVRMRLPQAALQPGFLHGTLTGDQQLVYGRVVALLEKRARLRDSQSSEESWDDSCRTDRATAVVGGPGTGKTFTVLNIILACRRLGFEVAVFTPAARLGGLYRESFPDAYVDTVHAGFGIPVDADAQSTAAAWTFNLHLAKYTLWVIDEVSMLSRCIADHIVRTWEETARWPVLLFAGDFYQLERVGGINSVGNALTSRLWQRVVALRQLQPSDVQRCRDPALLAFLAKARVTTVTHDDVAQLIAGRLIDDSISHVALARLYRRHPNATILAYSNKRVRLLNQYAAEILHEGRATLGRVALVSSDWTEETHLELVEGARIVLTYNFQKSIGAVNGAEAVVQQVGRFGIRVMLAKGVPYIVPPMHATVLKDGREQVRQQYHIAPGYCITVHKAQGLTLAHACVCLSGQGKLPPGLGYVAVSRVSTRDCLTFLGNVGPQHFQPVELPDWRV